MIHLSKRGWNNVLIFSMLVMIMIFNGMHKKLSIGETDNPKSPLLPSNSLLLSLSAGQFKIERIGKTWRSTSATLTAAITDPSTDLSTDPRTDTIGGPAQLAQLIDHWQQLPLTVLLDDSEAQVMTRGKMPEDYVVAAMAGIVNGVVYAFYPQVDHVFVHDQGQDRWFSLTLPEYQQVVPDFMRTTP